MNTVIEKIKNDEILNKIKTFSEDKVYVVGGTVRDFYLGKSTFDKDIVVFTENVCEYAKQLAKFLDATFIELDSENEIYRLVLKDKLNFIDVAKPINNSLEQDLKRRDLTLNSIAVCINDYQIFDVNNGISDLKNGIIKMISEKNLLDDNLRLLRVFRFQSVLGFEVESETFNTVKKHFKLINNPAKERINYELMKMFAGRYTAKAIVGLDKTGLLCEILPVMNDVKKVPPNTHHHLPLLYHLISTCEKIQEFYDSGTKLEREHLEKVDFGGFSRLTHLKLAAFLHDIGKFSTWIIEENTGRHRFFKHEDVGSKMSVEILKDLKFSKRQIDYISAMIKYHLYPSQVISDENLNDKMRLRYVRKLGENVIDNILLAKSDRLSALGEAVTEEMVLKNISGLDALKKYYFEVKESLKELPKLIDGTEIMAICGIDAGKELGQIIEELHEAQACSDVLTKEDAKIFVQKKAKLLKK